MKTRSGVAIVLALLVGAVFPAHGFAQSVAFLDGTVTEDGEPATAVVVRADGNNGAFTTKSDRSGRFRFTTLQPGSYTLTANDRGRSASIRVTLPASGTTVALDLGLATVGRVVSRPASPLRGSGTDLTLTPAILAHSVAATSFPNLLLQLPGAARGANGVVHINGDHGDINYIVDGMPIPQELNRVVGTEFDLSNAAFIDVIQGAYPAQYGGRFASVIEVSTREGSEGSGYSASLSSDTQGQDGGSLFVHRPLGNVNIILSLRAQGTARGLDAPEFGMPEHDRAGDANGFARATMPAGASGYINLDLSNSWQTFQIPNDVAAGEPASTDDVEQQSDSYSSISYHRAIAQNASIALGASYKRSRIRDFGDPANDFTYGEDAYIESGGNPTDCARALSTGRLGSGTCAYSLDGDRTASDIGLIASYALQWSTHSIRAGVLSDSTLVAKSFAITLQPNNFLAPIFTPAAPSSPYTALDESPNVGHTESAYAEDTWRMGSRYELQYGVREDAFTLFSTQFSDAARQLSPRVKVTRFLGPRSSVYAYYGRFFTPFSFENVSPATAHILNLPLQAATAAFDLRPQRDSDYEIGGHLPLARGDLGLRVMQKNATDLIDDTQIGVTALHQDINYALGRIATQTAYYQQPLARDGRFYLSMNHTYSVNRGCETQLLAPCFGSPDDWTPADHEQRWGATSGIVTGDARGGWFSADAEYGSGLSSAACAPSVAACKYTPHTVFDAEQGVRLGPSSTLVIRVENLLNDRYYITLLNAQGNHVSSGRTLGIELRLAAASPR